ncbi:MAG: cytidine deaminase, partial [Pseudomonadota bacterium]|nr:cytidine deaminase [Pseudomonadota bacterium]
MSLKDAAAAVRENAHAPYSNFKVGAAIRAAS